MPRSATASQVRSKSDMSWPDSAFMAAVGVAACRMAAAALRTVSSRSWAARGQLPHLLDPGSGDVADALAHGVDGAGQSGSSTTNSSMATPASRSSTSSPITLPSTAPISAATAPSTPGASGSQMRMRVEHRPQCVLVMCTPTCMVCSALPA